MAGHDVGIVVVGESPYAEGVGDVGNDENSLELTAADRATIDRVCAAMTCVVLIVSGRPQTITDRLSEIDTLIASFLPGSEGAGGRRRPLRGEALHGYSTARALDVACTVFARPQRDRPPDVR